MKQFSKLLAVNISLVLFMLTSCKKEIAMPEENTPVQPVIQNTAPVANAGLDMKIELPQNFTVLQGGFYNADRNVKKVE